MMRKYIINPNLSAHEQLFGIFNFNFTQLAPPGTRILVHENPEKRATYAPHGSFGWYIGRAPLHSRYFKCYTTSTKFERTSGTVDFFPQYLYMPKTYSEYAAAIAASKWIHDLKNQHSNHHSKLKNLHYLSLKTTRKIQICSTTTIDPTATAR